MGMPGCACIPPDGDDWTKPWLQECDHHNAQRIDAERWRAALSAYERGVVMSHDGRTGEKDGYVTLFLAAIRERDSAGPNAQLTGDAGPPAASGAAQG